MWSGQRARAAIAATLPAPCPFCGRLVKLGQAWDVDHATPRIHGGTDTAGNLRPAHAACNRAAGARLGRGLRRWPS